MLDSNLLEAIAQMDTDDLNEVVKFVNLRRRRIGDKIRRGLSVGMRVKFQGKKQSSRRYLNGLQRGEIVKINPKTVKVKATNGVTWTVSPGLLEVDE